MSLIEKTPIVKSDWNDECIDGYYYLHDNGHLIYKSSASTPKAIAELDDSDFVVRTWPVDIKNRATAWKIVLEAFALDANEKDVKRLIKYWHLTKTDCFEMMVRNINPTDDMLIGIKIYVREVLRMTWEQFEAQAKEWGGMNCGPYERRCKETQGSQD